ncbi:hypothetical protein [Bifidobacterium sp. ESL0764]|uniref:hypothetical protein n=1 Tax=Bifidobacterium sp. ESL0764 TaxID=2983228 RepID=UPI0023F8AA9E|nr:hypothetical protein [Bifidobacterium sp. ESL0764]WEV65613.1 hypothetical protein OZX71_07665 [Bifidobacterium sp. ESL0764]
MNTLFGSHLDRLVEHAIVFHGLYRGETKLPDMALPIIPGHAADYGDVAHRWHEVDRDMDAVDGLDPLGCQHALAFSSGGVSMTVGDNGMGRLELLDVGSVGEVYGSDPFVPLALPDGYAQRLLDGMMRGLDPHAETDMSESDDAYPAFWFKTGSPRGRDVRLTFASVDDDGVPVAGDDQVAALRGQVETVWDGSEGSRQLVFEDWLRVVRRFGGLFSPVPAWFLESLTGYRTMVDGPLRI